MRYEVSTKLSLPEAMAQAKKYFGLQGVGLELIDERENFVAFQGGGGHVAVAASAGDKKTTLELETREWDYAVRQFMEQVS